MKKSFALSLLFIPSILFSQSLLWKVTGSKLEKPSYLYGTIHIQDKRVFSYGSVVEEKLKEVDAYAMEILLDSATIVKTKDAQIMKKNTIKDFISDEDFALLSKVFKEKTGSPIFIFEKMKPFFLMSYLEQTGMSKDMDDPLDLHFLKLAEKLGKKTYGVEKYEDQLGAIDQIPLQEQADMLMKTVKDTSTGNNEFEDLLITYLTGDIEKMPELDSDTSMPENFNEIFLTRRNVTMAKNAIKLYKKHPAFVAIGAAHLGGEKGVISLLRKEGYTVEPVLFEFREE